MLLSSGFVAADDEGGVSNCRFVAAYSLLSNISPTGVRIVIILITFLSVIRSLKHLAWSTAVCGMSPRRDCRVKGV